ncbi:MAG: DHHA1 domain-containing protein [Thermoflexales bacterium]
MTERLYRLDSFLMTFAARVLECGPVEAGTAVVLDRTGFYAAAGGQPCDFGLLGRVPVIDVAERPDGAIVHILGASPDFAPGDTVTGTIDFRRRFDFMQQHSGQHLLSQALVRTSGAETLSVHFGEDASTIDVDSAALSVEQLAALEDEVNRAVQSDLAVIVREVPEVEVAAYGLRRPPKVTGIVRIVEFEGYDWSACGGTHVRRSGQVGAVTLVRSEKRRGGIRLTFLCGNRAILHHRALNAQAVALGERLSVAALEVLPAFDRWRDESQALRERLIDATELLLDAEAARLRAASRRIGAESWIVATLEGREPEAVRALAKRLASDSETVVLLASAGARTFFCFSRSPDAMSDMAALLREALARVGAKGGGSAAYAQGGGPAATREATEAILAGLVPG